MGGEELCQSRIPQARAKDLEKRKRFGGHAVTVVGRVGRNTIVLNDRRRAKMVHRLLAKRFATVLRVPRPAIVLSQERKNVVNARPFVGSRRPG